MKDKSKDIIQMLDDSSLSEQKYQEFYEKYPGYFYAPFLLNHDVHMDWIISKLPIDTSLTTDFVYLTKSSAEWWICLVEFETPHKRLLNKDNSISSDLSKGLAQIQSWKDFIVRSGQEVIRRIDPLMHPLNGNKVSFKYILVIGRSKSLDTIKKRDAFSSLSNHDTRVLTFDSFRSGSLSNRRFSKSMLTLSKDRFKFKYGIKDPSNLINWFKPDAFDLSKDDIVQMRAEGLSVDQWLAGENGFINGVKSEDFLESFWNARKKENS
jgi:hypothetical protein